MTTETLTAEQILNAAEEVLRRFGPRKTTVVDVARQLDVSHGTVYRHFASKAALREAVTARWLHRISAPLAEIADQDEPAPDRLRRWLLALAAAKRKKVSQDAEIFAAYLALAEDAVAAARAHVAHLIAQVAGIIADGMAAGEFAAGDPEAAAKTVFDATARFHHPVHHRQWSDPGEDQALDRVCTLVMAGLRAGL